MRIQLDAEIIHAFSFGAKHVEEALKVISLTADDPFRLAVRIAMHVRHWKKLEKAFTQIRKERCPFKFNFGEILVISPKSGRTTERIYFKERVILEDFNTRRIRIVCGTIDEQFVTFADSDKPVPLVPNKIRHSVRDFFLD